MALKQSFKLFNFSFKFLDLLYIFYGIFMFTALERVMKQADLFKEVI